MVVATASAMAASGAVAIVIWFPSPRPAMKTMLDKQMRKTKLCHFHQIGVCKHGASCAFAHAGALAGETPIILYYTTLL